MEFIIPIPSKPLILEVPHLVYVLISTLPTFEAHLLPSMYLHQRTVNIKRNYSGAFQPAILPARTTHYQLRMCQQLLYSSRHVLIARTALVQSYRHTDTTPANRTVNPFKIKHMFAQQSAMQSFQVKFKKRHRWDRSSFYTSRVKTWDEKKDIPWPSETQLLLTR